MKDFNSTSLHFSVVVTDSSGDASTFGSSTNEWATMKQACRDGEFSILVSSRNI